jgi:hypothetical protein
MMGLIIVVLLTVFGWFVGHEDARIEIKNACVAKYADMPYNKVEAYCKTLLKFEKDAKQ